MTAKQGSPTTDAGRALHDRYTADDYNNWFGKAIAAIEVEARQQALTDAITAVGTEVPSITAINDVRFYDRMMSQSAVIDTLTRLRDRPLEEQK